MVDNDLDDRDRRRSGPLPETPDAAHRRAAFGRRPDDVPVLPERRRRVLPWVLAALLLLALLPLLGRLRGPAEGGDVAARPDSVTTAVSGGEVDRGASAGAIDRFEEWAEEGGSAALPQESEANHPYTSQGIRLLADALGEATRKAGLAGAEPRVAEIRAQAERLRTSDGEDRHAEYAHAAFTSAARLVAELHDPRNPGASNGGELMSLARAVDPDRPLSPQGERVRRFFRAAADALD